MQTPSSLNDASNSTAAPPGGRLARAFDLTGRVVVITGASGLLGREHAEAIAEAGGTPILSDLRADSADNYARELSRKYGVPAQALELDVTRAESVKAALASVLESHGRIDVLVNNAARNPKMEDGSINATRFENLSLDYWWKDIEVGLTGAFLCSQVFGSHMAAQGGGVILNIASDLGVIAPDQRIYRKPGLAPHEQPVKPVTYSVVKGGLVMFTKYLATYWAEANVRVNSLCPGGVFAGQPPDFVERLTNLVPMGRMAMKHEYKAAVVFLCSDASSYMTGSNLIVDGGRTCW
jgi:NAD(P)-dependent dehydrogenase (short-subunit alcohol dehydrogenase family)